MKQEDLFSILRDAMATGNPSKAIERQEERGQQALIQGNQLPTKGLTEVANALGIRVIGVDDNDPLFSAVLLPHGWKIAATDHTMWSDLLDETGTKQAAIFFKAAAYDREATIHLVS